MPGFRQIFTNSMVLLNMNQCCWINSIFSKYFGIFLWKLYINETPPLYKTLSNIGGCVFKEKYGR